jgi:hypothetical protein
MSALTLAHLLEVHCRSAGQPPALHDAQEDIFWLEPPGQACVGVQCWPDEDAVHLFATAGYAPADRASEAGDEPADLALWPHEGRFDLGQDEQGRWLLELDGSTGRLTLDLAVPLAALDPDSFAARLDGFLRTLRRWAPAFESDPPADAVDAARHPDAAPPLWLAA